MLREPRVRVPTDKLRVLVPQSENPRDPARTLAKNELESLVAGTLRAGGAADADAEAVARVLVWADLHDLPDQGVARLDMLAKRIVAGLIASPAHTAWQDVASASAVLDAGNAFGQVAGRDAMDRAIDLARAHGVGFVAVRNSNHYGAAGWYAMRAAEAGCIGITGSNSFPKVAPPGGADPILGTNPFAFACPAAAGAPLLVDFSTASSSGFAVTQAAASGAPLPPGIALDRDGHPTTDADAVADGGCLLPSAGGGLVRNGLAPGLRLGSHD